MNILSQDFALQEELNLIIKNIQKLVHDTNNIIVYTSDEDIDKSVSSIKRSLSMNISPNSAQLLLLSTEKVKGQKQVDLFRDYSQSLLNDLKVSIHQLKKYSEY